MGDMGLNRSDSTLLEASLQHELVRANRAVSGVAPIVSHMLESSGQSMVNEAVIARLHGMMASLALDLSTATQATEATADPRRSDLADALSDNAALVCHLHALAIEGIFLDRLTKQSAIDPVISPLLQELIASDNPKTAELAMSTLAAQSRFVQQQRRMQHSLTELPFDLFGMVLDQFSADQALINPAVALDEISSLKSSYDEGKTRIGLLSRLISSMGTGALAALDVEHAGLALFASALAARSGQQRDLCVLACHSSQAARLTLALRAAGLELASIERQFQLLGIPHRLSSDIARMEPEKARDLLSQFTPRSAA